MIEYVKGDATRPIACAGENMVIAHICNDVGAWGAGFVMALSATWPQPERAYRRWHRDSAVEKHSIDWPPFTLGEVIFVPVTDKIIVANMIAQMGVPGPDHKPVRYDALEQCLAQVNSWALESDRSSVHMPRIGCGLGGGKWEEIEPIIERTLTDCHTKVYDL